jgi:hypothetical protein
MSEVTQTDTGPGTGNCLQAAVASLLDLPLEEVPHFILHSDWEVRFWTFMEDHGYTVRQVLAGPGVTGIAVGPTVRGTFHAVVMADGEVVWDPHPSRHGLLRVAHVYAVSS